MNRRPSPALLISITALVLGLAGTTYAASQLGHGTVGAFQLRQGAVTSSKIRDGAVTPAKIAGCGTNAIKIGPGCVETGLRGPAGYTTAVADCANAGGRLPFISELTAIQALGQPLGNPELVADMNGGSVGSGGSGKLRQAALFASGRDVVTEPIDTQHRYRCVLSAF
jgi:hypothetical protein